MQILIINGKILSPHPVPEGYAILVEDGRISALAPEPQFSPEIPCLDASGMWVVPGLIDVHVHGGAGADTMDARHDALHLMSDYFASKGVTSFLPTTVAASKADSDAAIDCVGSYRQSKTGARVLGIHLEGPYLAHPLKGAQPGAHIRPADPVEYLPWLQSGLVRMVTVAPEIDGVMEMIDHGTALGIKFAVGHSQASYDQVCQAIDSGLTQSTHTFNAMTRLDHFEPGVLGAVLTDERVFVDIICDGVHLHPAIVKLVVSAKGPDRTVLITDAIRAVGAGDGQHRLGDHIIEVKDGIARTSTGKLAGSTITMDRALRNAAAFAARDWQALLPSATSTAAMCLGMSDEMGAIKPGLLADIVFLDRKLQPALTMVDGEIVYKRDEV